MFTKIFRQILKRKFIAGISLALIITGGYFGYQALAKDNASSTRYITAAASRGTLIVSLSESGQVSASEQVDIKPKVSGEVVDVKVKNNQEVENGALLAQVDSRDAQKAVDDAKTNLKTAQLELSALLAPPDELDVLQAKNDLATAQRNLEELVSPGESALTQAENALIGAQDSLTKLKSSQANGQQNALDAQQKAEDNLVSTYEEDAFNIISNSFLDLPTLITNLEDVLYSYEIAESETLIPDYLWNISTLSNSVDYVHYNERYQLDRYQLGKLIENAENNYKIAKEKYDKNSENYSNASRYPGKDIIEELLNGTLDTVKTMAETVKSEANMLDYWIDYQSRHDRRIYPKVAEYQSNITSYASKINSHLSSLLSTQRSLEDKKEAVLSAERDLEIIRQNYPLDLATAERSLQEKKDALDRLKNPEQYDIDAAQLVVQEKEATLKNLQDGADELDIRAKKLAVQQKEDALLSAQQNLADYYIRAPFDGVVTSLNVKKGESVSSSAIATLITKQKIAETTLNEIDIAQVKIGQKANIVFDAIDGLNITGEVVEMDTLGTVTQGVVTYGVKIAFDTQDERIKPGMSLSATIITNLKQDALLVPNSAIKQQGDISYVQVADKPAVQFNLAAANISGSIIPASSLRAQQIQIGLSNDTMTEVLSGLQENDLIVTQIISPDNQTSSQQNSGFSSGGQRMINIMH